jgi:hypothetical protein
MKILLFLVGIVGTAVALVSIDERNRTALFNASGRVEKGSKLGIEIGLARDEAARRLKKRGFSFDRALQTPGACLYWTYTEDQLVERWSDRSWRRGTVCLAFREGKVVSIGWRFEPIETP